MAKPFGKDSRIRMIVTAGFLALSMAVCLFGCKQPGNGDPIEYEASKQVVQEWNRMLLELERLTPGYRAPVSARMFAYVSSAAWQAALPGLNGYCSLENYCPQYRKLSSLPACFYLPASLNAAYAEILRQFFPTAPPYLIERINAMEAGFARQFEPLSDPEAVRQSTTYGKKSALAIWRWSVSDSVGHEGYLFNFDRNYVPPDVAGGWRPGGDHPLPALLPNWGQVRPFVVAKDEVPVRDPIPADSSPGTAYFAEALEVYALSHPISEENRRIAEFWSDDVPGLSVTPAGHWISIAIQAVDANDLSLPQILELYLKLGFAMSDAIVTCWNAKYRFNRERPEAVIRTAIQPDWKPLHDAPPFPSYPSGHAVLGAAAATVLTAFIGPNCELTDRTNTNHPEYHGITRHFNSFEQMALENAGSRIALGVHFRMDCEEGLRIGRLIGRQVAAMPLGAPEFNLGAN